MSKRSKQKSKQRAGHRRSFGSFFGGSRVRQPDSAIFAMQADALLEAGKPDEALDLLEPLLEDYPRSPQLLGTAAVAYLHVGDLWSAIDCLERSQKVQPEAVVWATLAGLYIQVGLHAYTRTAIYHSLKGMHGSQDRMALEAMVE
jgi:predicted Zn-dependent protease